MRFARQSLHTLPLAQGGQLNVGGAPMQMGGVAGVQIGGAFAGGLPGAPPMQMGGVAGVQVGGPPTGVQMAAAFGGAPPPQEGADDSAGPPGGYPQWGPVGNKLSARDMRQRMGPARMKAWRQSWKQRMLQQGIRSGAYRPLSADIQGAASESVEADAERSSPRTPKAAAMQLRATVNGGPRARTTADYEPFFAAAEGKMNGIMDAKVPSLLTADGSRLEDAADPAPLPTAESVLGRSFRGMALTHHHAAVSSAQSSEFVLDTTLGEIAIKLREDAAPKAAAILRQMVAKKLYDGCTFYRAEPGFVVQGGLRDEAGQVRHNQFGPFPFEYKLPNKRATVTMARFPDTNSGTGEFFINLQDNPSLNARGSPGYGQGFEVFGEVVRGMDVVSQISGEPTNFRPELQMHTLKRPIVIRRATIIDQQGGHASSAASLAPAALMGHPQQQARGKAFVLDTTMGRLVIRLREDAAPRASAILQKMVQQHLYDNCVFYRAEPGFVVQGGLRDSAGATRPNPFGPFPLEYNLPNKRGTVTMARYTDPDSGTGEFFVNLKDNPSLDRSGGPGYGQGFEVFGEVQEGMQVAEAISSQPTTPQFGMNMLTSPVVIRSATIVEF